ncbi:MAG: TonB-dependent receptor [Antricoccus sp.]
MRKTKLSKGLMLACGGVLLSAGQSALAQTSSAQTLERVEITGSNIRRIANETASPVQTLTRQDIEKSGRASVAELLQTLSVDNQGSVPKNFGAGFASGASGISLRGLGTASTLVLLNGRRIAPYGLADDGQKIFTDLNLIPLDAVERVEILKDGGSAIYGSDAIAGVVNIILRHDFNGLTTNVSYGTTQYGNGQEKRASITGGFGNLETQGWNILGNLEIGKQGEIYNRDITNRKWIGASDLRPYGYDADSSGGANGGTGAIISGGAAAVSAINGNVRNPNNNLYYNRGNQAGLGFTRTFPGAACANFTNHPQGDPGGGCLIDAAQQYSQIQPSQEYQNFFARGTLNITANMQGYSEFNYYHNKSVSYTTPSGVHGSVGYPGGPVNNANSSLGAANPDNPYFGTQARLRYVAGDVGPRVSDIDNNFYRFLVGIKGAAAGWDYDSAFLYSEDKVANSRNGYLQRDATFALLNPTGKGATQLSTTLTNAQSAAMTNAAYAALPAGTYWRIAENAGLNSPAVYAALSPTISNNASSKVTQIDAKASREIAQLPAGALSLAVGGEVRHESVSLQPTQGTDRGNIIGLGYSAYDGGRTVFAGYAELLAPVTKQVELSAALRYDHYSDAGSSTTPKLGVKYTPMRELALRGTYARGFRAPSPAENGRGGLAAYSTASDPLRCALGIASACSAASLAVITSPNPALEPEKSTSYTLGLVFEPASKTSIAVDYFDIKRKNEINQQITSAAIAAGNVVRDPGGADPAHPGDPGPILAVLGKYVNSSQTTVRGFDVDAKQGFSLGSNWGQLTLSAQWTHLSSLKRTDPDGSTFEFAGTHGNCDVTNCIGTPADRVNFGAAVDTGPFRIGANLNYRASIENKNFKNDPNGCASIFADGSDAPGGCRLASFTTVDLVGRWLPIKNLEVYGSVRNIFNRTAPLDPLTYGQVSFNPLDYAGAIGRYYQAGIRYKFF